MENMTFHDHKPAALSLHDAVVGGLSRRDKSIPPKFFYDERGSALFDRIEMHLVSKRAQTLRLNGHRFEFKVGESVHTENSYKYAPPDFLNLASKSGFSEIRHWIDGDGLFGIYLLEA